MTRLLRPLFILSAAALLPLAAHAEDEVGVMSFRAEPGNLPSAQRGARDFMAYCSGCHSMKYLRYNRMGADLEISDAVLKTNLMFTSDKPGDTIISALPAQAEQWFGRLPPDLSLETKARGADWVYTYLQSFYLDPTRPLGVNNTLLPGVSMPAVLGELQGWQTKAEDGHMELVAPGSLSPEEYKAFISDLTNFMVYASEPIASERVGIGIKVFFFLLVLLGLSYFLKKEFWRDIH